MISFYIWWGVLNGVCAVVERCLRDTKAYKINSKCDKMGGDNDCRAVQLGVVSFSKYGRV